MKTIIEGKRTQYRNQQAGLVDREKELRSELERVRADIIACSGAIQACDQILGAIGAQPEPDQSKT